MSFEYQMTLCWNSGRTWFHSLSSCAPPRHAPAKGPSNATDVLSTAQETAHAWKQELEHAESASEEDLREAQKKQSQLNIIIKLLLRERKQEDAKGDL